MEIGKELNSFGEDLIFFVSFYFLKSPQFCFSLQPSAHGRSVPVRVSNCLRYILLTFMHVYVYVYVYVYKYINI